MSNWNLVMTVQFHYECIENNVFPYKERHTEMTKYGKIHSFDALLYSWKYWLALNLAIWLQTKHSKILVGSKFCLWAQPGWLRSCMWSAKILVKLNVTEPLSSNRSYCAGNFAWLCIVCCVQQNTPPNTIHWSWEGWNWNDTMVLQTLYQEATPTSSGYHSVRA